MNSPRSLVINVKAGWRSDINVELVQHVQACIPGLHTNKMFDQIKLDLFYCSKTIFKLMKLSKSDDILTLIKLVFLFRAWSTSGPTASLSTSGKWPRTAQPGERLHVRDHSNLRKTIQTLNVKRLSGKNKALDPSATVPCQLLGKLWASSFGLQANMRKHRHWQVIFVPQKTTTILFWRIEKTTHVSISFVLSV